MTVIKVLIASANYPNDYHLWAPWNKEANIAIAKNEWVMLDTIAPVPYSIPYNFFPYHEISKIPMRENGPEGMIHRPRFLYLFPKKIFYGFEGYFYRRSVEKYLENLQKPDLIHCHHVYPDGYGLLKSCEKWNIPLIVDIHRPSLFTEYLENKAISKQTAETLNFASKIVCISQEIKDYAIEYGINKEKLEFIQLGVDTNIFKNNKVMNENLEISEKKVILFVGQLIKRKGLNFLIEAVASLSEDIKMDLNVIIIGTGEEKIHLEHLCHNMGLDNIFEFKGNVDRTKIPYYFSIADIFVLPSLAEGRPVVINEAMSSECAIIATNVDGIPEQITEGYDGFLVKPKDSEAIARKIQFLLENENIRKELGKNARKSIFKNNLTWNDYSTKVVELYNKIMGR